MFTALRLDLILSHIGLGGLFTASLGMVSGLTGLGGLLCFSSRVGFGTGFLSQSCAFLLLVFGQVWQIFSAN